MNRVTVFLMLVVLFVALPLLFIDLILIALDKLAINPAASPAIVFLMLFGSVVNIPVFKQTIKDSSEHHPLQLWGLEDRFPHLFKQSNQQIIAVNLGGALVPLMIVIYEIQLVYQSYPHLLSALAVAVMVNCIACYLIARPVTGLGIVIPAFFPGLLAALSALWLAPDMAPPIAFCAGVLGPLIGADLMHMPHILANTRGIASIGGAGTFDGIVISGLVAVLLV